jgi:hypothetical protein
MSENAVSTLLLIEPSEQAPRNSEGSIIQLKDGTLLLAYSRFIGGSHDNSGAQIMSRASPDGQRWSGDALLVEKEGRENVMSVSLVRIASGEILLFYLAKNGWDDCKLYVRRSRDEMKTLGDRVLATPQEGYHVVNNDRVVQLSSGRLVVPAALHPSTGNRFEGWSHRGIAMCFLSDDEGRTWRKSGTELIAPLDSKSGLQEPGVVELSHGQLYMWMRTDMGFQFESYSEDGGETWSEARRSPIASPLSPASIKRVPWGKELLLVWNDHSGKHPFPPGKRTPLCTAISRDEGRTWENSKILEGDPDGWYCYTSITFVGDSAILGYCAGDSKGGGLNRLKVNQVKRDWLYA